jgi:hypothetical protein
MNSCSGRGRRPAEAPVLRLSSTIRIFLASPFVLFVVPLLPFSLFLVPTNPAAESKADFRSFLPQPLRRLQSNMSSITIEKPNSSSFCFNEHCHKGDDDVERISQHETSDEKKSFENVLDGEIVIEELRKRKHGGSTDEVENGALIPDDVFPDGGLRAWLVVFGVCRSRLYPFVIRF